MVQLYKVCINHDPGNEQKDKRFIFMKIFLAQGIVCPKAIYMYINDPGHMTKMAAMAINSKNLLKSSSPEPEGL